MAEIYNADDSLAGKKEDQRVSAEPARLLLLAEAVSTSRAVFENSNTYLESEHDIPGLSISDSGAKNPGSDSRHGLRPFDGHELYDAAFDALMTYHLLLDSSSLANDFARNWEHKYDQSKKLESEAGADQAVREMLRSLGQRFDYFHDRKSIEEKARRTSGGHVGIGVRLGLSNNNPENLINEMSQLQIEDLSDNTPAAKAGLKAGDLIKEVDHLPVNGMHIEDAVAKIRGDAGVPVTLLIERMDAAGKKSELQVNLVREKVQLQSVWKESLEGGITYVKLHDFDSGQAGPAMAKALKEAASESKGLILDLRGNPGGNLETAHDIAGMLLEDGPFIVSRARNDGFISETERGFNKYLEYSLNLKDPGRSGAGQSSQKRPELLIPHDLPIVVLVNEGSASSAEILAGALQYNRRAEIVGMPTLGKGVAQTIVPLPFGRRLHVTSMEFAPGRQPNDWVGIIPDQQLKNGTNPNFDEQLDKAKSILKDEIAEIERKAQERLEQKKLHEAEFEESVKQKKF